MKELKSKKMRSLLSRGKRRAKGRPPNEGMMLGLINETAPNGWHYQVEWIHDQRIAPKPYIIAYAFHPTMAKGSATHFLRH